jgi:hypothetical protein
MRLSTFSALRRDLEQFWLETEIWQNQGENKIKQQNNAQRHSPRPTPNDWYYFWPTLVFAVHYL